MRIQLQLSVKFLRKKEVYVKEVAQTQQGLLHNQHMSKTYSSFLVLS